MQGPPDLGRVVAKGQRAVGGNAVKVLLPRMVIEVRALAPLKTLIQTDILEQFSQVRIDKFYVRMHPCTSPEY
jgi:hypothetical protein